MSHIGNQELLDRCWDEVWEMEHDEVMQYLGQYRSLEGWQEMTEEQQYYKAIELKYEEYMWE